MYLIVKSNIFYSMTENPPKLGRIDYYDLNEKKLYVGRGAGNQWAYHEHHYLRNSICGLFVHKDIVQIYLSTKPPIENVVDLNV